MIQPNAQYKALRFHRSFPRYQHTIGFESDQQICLPCSAIPTIVDSTLTKSTHEVHHEDLIALSWAGSRMDGDSNGRYASTAQRYLRR
jgi:hypothetical protein